MGFLNTLWNALLPFASFAPFSGNGISQQPLPLPTQGVVIHPHGASEGFHCIYPKEWDTCNGPNTRDCWLKPRYGKHPFSQFDIHTDYEYIHNYPPGITREYWLEVNDKALAPDGYIKPLGKVFNDTFPGPLIEACWGDDIVVHVTNRLKTNGTTIHWHGIRQLHTNEMDGVNGVTQCPIAEGETFTYKFKARQYGHSWMHSHYSLQYPDGVAGPLLIHGPTSANWDEAWTPILINDWFHDSAFAEFQVELDGDTSIPRGDSPVSDSILVNGTGNFDCPDAKDPRCVGGNSYFTKTFETGKRYLLRLINASTDMTFYFSIDNHILEVVSTDLVPIHPFKTESILIGVGQRYSVIVEAAPKPPSADGSYWIRTSVVDGNVGAQGINETTGIIRYNNTTKALPSTTKHASIPDYLGDEEYKNLVPVVPWQVGTRPDNNVSNNTYEAGISDAIEHGARRWDLTDSPLWLNFSNPTILNLKNTTWDPQYAIVDYDYSQGWVYIVITGYLARLNITKANQSDAHPIHLHGHDFAILAQRSNATYDEKTALQTFNFNNPPRRDVAMLLSDGYLALAWRPDNPGVWLLHCHIAWHASSGLALQILENQGNILSTVGSLEKTKETCRSWNAWYAGHRATFDQDDSGI